MYGRPRSRRRTHLALERHRLVPAVISNGSGGSLYYFRSDQVPRLVAYRGSHRSCRAHQADERPLLPQCYPRSRDDLAERRDQRSRSGHGACPIHGDGTHVEPPLWAAARSRSGTPATAQIGTLWSGPWLPAVRPCCRCLASSSTMNAGARPRAMAAIALRPGGPASTCNGALRPARCPCTAAAPANRRLACQRGDGARG